MKQVNKQAVYRDSILQALKKLAPAVQVHNPVMFIVYIGAIFTTILFIANIAGITDEPSWYVFVIALILWFTVLFANFAEAIAEGRGRAQAESLKKSRKQVIAHKLSSIAEKEAYTDVSSSELQVGDICYVKTGEIIPMDGEVIEGIASVDESAITGESAPVIRESGGDRSAVTGGTTVVSDWIVLRVTAASGASFLDKMIAMVEGAARKKTPNEIALQILLITLTIIFLMVCATLLPISRYVRDMVGQGSAVSLSNVVALLVCLAPTTIGALLSSIGIAGMSRLNQANVLAMSGRAIEAAGDVDVAKYFAIIPVLFMGIFPNLAALNIMHLTSTTTAILSAVIYNAFIIIALIPLSLRGVKYRELPADKQLRHNLMIYGVGGIILPFIVIKLIDMALTMCGIA